MDLHGLILQKVNAQKFQETIFHLNGGVLFKFSWVVFKKESIGLNTRIKIIYKLETIKHYHDVQLMQVSKNDAIW